MKEFNLHRQMRKSVSSAVTYACITAPFSIGAIVSCKLSGHFNLQATADKYLIRMQKLLLPTRQNTVLFTLGVELVLLNTTLSTTKWKFTSVQPIMSSQCPQLWSLPRNNLFIWRLHWVSDLKKKLSTVYLNVKEQGFPVQVFNELT